MILFFNAKAVIVGIATVVSLFITTKLGMVGEWNFIICGIVAMIVSILLSRPYTGYARLPLVFFIPTHVIALLLIIIGMSVWVSNVRKSPAEKAAEAKHEADAKMYGDSIRHDLAILDRVRLTGDTALIGEADRYMQANIMRSLAPERNHYLVKYNKDSSKVLFLMKTGDVASMKKEIKGEQGGKMMAFFTEAPFLQGREAYVGIISDDRLFMVYTSDGVHEKSFLHDEDDLAPFYMDKKDTKKGMKNI
jgi:hypothetical protein